jgi:hypothetical protein
MKTSSPLINKTKDMDYNSQRPQLRVPEYGRNIQLLIEYIIKNFPDREERSRAAWSTVNMMAQQNPQQKNQLEYIEKLWNHLFRISDYQLDVDAPVSMPDAKIRSKQKPGRISYPLKKIKYHFYGGNVVSMINKAIEMEEGDAKDRYVMTIASYMKLSYRTWNDDKVSDEIIIKHLGELSRGKLFVDRISDIVSNGKPQEKFFNRDFRKSKPKWYNKKNNRREG